MDIQGLRAATPGCEERIHLSNAGAAMQTAGVLAGVAEHSQREIALGGYEAQLSAADLFARGRDHLATIVGTDGDHIALAESGTLAWWRVLDALGLGRGDRVLVTRSEYLGTVLPLVQRGVVVDVLPDGPDGTLALDGAAAALAEGPVAAVVACHAASHAGIVNDVTGLGEVVRREAPDVWYVVDGCQSVGQLPVDVGAMRCDFLVGTGRKWLRGPRGTAFLYASDRALDVVPARLDSNTGLLRGESVMAADGVARFEPWEMSWSAQAGLAAAAAELVTLDREQVYSRIAGLAERVRSGLRTLPEVTVRDRGAAPGGIVSFVHERVPAIDLVAHARRAGFSIGLVPDNAPFDPAAKGPAAVRVSAHVYNTETEVDTLLDLLSGLS